MMVNKIAKVFSVVLVIYFLWEEVWIKIFMGRLYTIYEWGYNKVAYKIFLYSHSFDSYIQILLKAILLYCGLKILQKIIEKISM